MSSHGHSGAGLTRPPLNAPTSTQKGNCNARNELTTVRYQGITPNINYDNNSTPANRRRQIGGAYLGADYVAPAPARERAQVAELAPIELAGQAEAKAKTAENNFNQVRKKLIIFYADNSPGKDAYARVVENYRDNAIRDAKASLGLWKRARNQGMISEAEKRITRLEKTPPLPTKVEVANLIKGDFETRLHQFMGKYNTSTSNANRSEFDKAAAELSQCAQRNMNAWRATGDKEGIARAQNGVDVLNKFVSKTSNSIVSR